MPIDEIINGILLIDKEAGISSYDVIRKLKKILPKGQKIGHAGTLDPFATGLLIILLGKATKLNDEIHKESKTYIATAEFGYETDTNDPTGRVIFRSDNNKPIAKETLIESIKQFSGDILQTPPAFSAKHVNGKRAYELARQGEKTPLKPQKVHIHKFEILKFAWPKVTFLIECSTGTYIRTLVSDLARTCKTYATLVELRRTEVSKFNASEAIKSQNLEDLELIKEKVIK